MSTFDYFKQYVSEQERIRAKTVHDEHIMEFRAMCAQMIKDAIPKILDEYNKRLVFSFQTYFNGKAVNSRDIGEEIVKILQKELDHTMIVIDI